LCTQTTQDERKRKKKMWMTAPPHKSAPYPLLEGALLVVVGFERLVPVSPAITKKPRVYLPSRSALRLRHFSSNKNKKTG
jgi:hypothetical protein